MILSDSACFQQQWFCLILIVFNNNDSVWFCLFSTTMILSDSACFQQQWFCLILLVFNNNESVWFCLFSTTMILSDSVCFQVTPRVSNIHTCVYTHMAFNGVTCLALPPSTVGLCTCMHTYIHTYVHIQNLTAFSPYLPGREIVSFHSSMFTYIHTFIHTHTCRVSNCSPIWPCRGTRTSSPRPRNSRRIQPFWPGQGGCRFICIVVCAIERYLHILQHAQKCTVVCTLQSDVHLHKYICMYV
jgi:hypothetical protein